MLTSAVPYDEAADFLSGKPAVTKAVFDKLLPELKARAFTIQGVDAADALQAARDAIAQIPMGADWRETKKELTAALKPWLGDGAAMRVEMLMRWHGYQAYSVANYENLEAMSDLFPYRQYQTAQDSRVRATHAALNGIVLPATSPFWDRHTPPWEYGCRCDVRGITREEAEEMMAEDAGVDERKRRVVEGPVLEELERHGRLHRGDNEIYDVRTKSERGESGPEWSTKDLRIPIDELRKRYDAPVWRRFEAWAKRTKVDGLGTVWDWLEGNTTPPAPDAQALIDHKKNFPRVGAAFRDHEGATGKIVEEAAAIIDEVHGDGVLPELRLNGPDNRLYWGYIDIPSAIGRPTVNVRGDSPWPLITAVHELGHYVDIYGFGNGRMGGSHFSAALDEWRDAVLASPSSIYLREKLKSMPKELDYYFMPTELFARSYSQWIAVRSGNADMLRQLEDIQKSQTFIQPFTQWKRAEFEPIAAALDKLFDSRGWLRPKA